MTIEFCGCARRSIQEKNVSKWDDERPSNLGGDGGGLGYLSKMPFVDL